ncbi:hypothetical protein [Fuscovulum ytuae]|uniref:Uncharacterized protein n=1 Tax=Fuscovulum ytuae TaxID=3042299 RepID=A0ABY8Q1V2_9RHOB|nr:hypothetical protein [Fuscovulum sp. YMD61]WGV14614.1 hypothetical protein QF092_09885 [Fuscovulum sp. YMD61]
MDGPKPITAFQRKRGYPERGASATHAAIADENGLILHAVAGGTCLQGSLDYFLGREVAVGRWSMPEKDRRVGELLHQARLMVGRRYEMGRMFLSLVTSARARDPFVCSTFVDAVFLMAFDDETPLHREGLPLLAPFVCPAHLFIQPGLHDP